jgi:hypothetical protein
MVSLVGILVAVVVACLCMSIIGAAQPYCSSFGIPMCKEAVSLLNCLVSVWAIMYLVSS